MAESYTTSVNLLDITLALSKYTYIITGTLTIGFLLALTFLTPNSNGVIQNRNLIITKRARTLAFIWSLSTLVFIVGTLAEILEVGFLEALDLTTLRSFLTQISLGRFLIFQAICALLIAIWMGFTARVTHLTLMLIIAIAGISSPVFQSHTASSGSHLIAIGTLIVHVIALALWIGGLAAILLNKELDRVLALKRFSAMALWVALSVIISGSVNGWIRMNFAAAWNGTYATLLIVKIALTAALLLIANVVRSRYQRSLEITKLLWFEFAFLLSIMFMGTLLSRTAPPTREEAVDPIEALVGLSYPGKPDLNTWLFEYKPDALILAILILSALLYFKGVRILRKRGDHWPIGRTISFVLGLLIINFAINGAIGIYAHFAFSYHMIEHMILGMIAPIPIVLSAPITLALRTLPGGRDSEDEGVRNLLIRFLHSRYSKAITNPAVALLIFDGSLFALYFTGLFGDLMGPLYICISILCLFNI